MKHTVTLHRDDLETIIKFIDAMNPVHKSVVLEVEDVAGIGQKIDAVINGIEVNGMRVTVSKEIVNEQDW